MPPEPWKTLSSREVYKNPWLRVREDIAEMPNGRTTLYGVAELGQCVGVLPFVSENEVVMLRQYRYITGENWRWEMPTGGMFPGEKPEEAARRELAEETGYRVGSLQWISTFTSSKSVVDETCHLFIGRDLSPGEAPVETASAPEEGASAPAEAAPEPAEPATEAAAPESEPQPAPESGEEPAS